MSESRSVPIRVSNKVLAPLLCSKSWVQRNDISVRNALLGIGGGVGPSAGIGLHQKIISNTAASGQDQGHFKLCHVSLAPSIADRTRYLLGEIATSPARGMAEAMVAIEAAARSTGDFAIAAIPCNTFHAPGIWSEFIDRLHAAGLNGDRLRLVDLIDETVAYVGELVPGCTRIGLLSTTGTRQVGVYTDRLQGRGYALVEVDYADQDGVHEAIYDSTWGLKAASPATFRARRLFEQYTDRLIEAGAEVVILACTEIPMALPNAKFKGVPLVDPVEACARSMIKLADVSKLRPLGTAMSIARTS